MRYNFFGVQISYLVTFVILISWYSFFKFFRFFYAHTNRIIVKLIPYDKSSNRQDA